MINTERVEQTITGNNMKHYLNLGYQIKFGDIIQIPIEHLPKHSRCKIDAACDRCNKKLKMSYATYNKYHAKQGFYSCIKCKTEKTIKTNKEKYNVEHVSQLDINKLKLKQTNIERYGVSSVLQHKPFLDKMKKTNLKKYGFEYTSQVDLFQEKIRNSLLGGKTKKNSESIEDIRASFKFYRTLVSRFTRKNKKELFNTWDGLDFYDSEPIKDNFSLHYTDRLYPTIDHKISVFYGFHNNIPAKDIGDISNLCITKRGNNSKKNGRCDLTF